MLFAPVVHPHVGAGEVALVVGLLTVALLAALAVRALTRREG